MIFPVIVGKLVAGITALILANALAPMLLSKVEASVATVSYTHLVSDNFRFRMHVDFDEANGADISGFTLGKIIR